MKYTIELTNKQKAQMDCIIDIVHRYVGFNPKLEPIKATNVEDTSEYQIGYKVGFEDGAKAQNEVQYSKGLEDGYKGYRYIKQWFASTCFFDTEDILFPEYKRRQADTCCLEDIISDVGFAEVLKRVKAYEEKKKADEESIKVGDIVKFNEKCHNYDHVKSREYLVLHIFDNGLVTILYDNGDTGVVDISLLDKTGRHFDEVSQLLDKLRGEDSE